MPGFVKSKPVTDEQRRANDQHSGRVVAFVLIAFAAYAYLFSNVGQLIGLPTPGSIAESLGLYSDLIFEDGFIDSSLRVYFRTGVFLNHAALSIYFGIAVLAFLAVYYLPLAYKQLSLVVASVLALVLVLGPAGTSAVLLAHILVYMVFHPVRRWEYFPVLGLLGATAFAEPRGGIAEWLMWFLVLSAGIGLLYRFVLIPLLERPKLGPWVRAATAHSTLIALTSLALFEMTTGLMIEFQIGLLLFFWNLARIIMYQLDYNDGLVPKDLPLSRFLAVFFTPGSIISWGWGPELGLGYAYCNNSFLNKNKNRIVMSGVKMMWLAMGYLVFGDWARNLLLDLLSEVGLPVHGGYIIRMVDHFMAGGEVSPATVLATSFLDTLRWTLRFVGVLHFKTAIWRICGYDFEPYFNKPWLATNLVNFWARYTYYYREFLLQAFYYPVFLRFFKKNPRLRLFVGTLAAAGFGNLIWGHATSRVDQYVNVLRTWPYYLFLSLGIAMTALYLLRFNKNKRRRPWTWSPRLLTDVMASYGTMQYFSLIHVMSRPSSGSNEWDLLRLMLRGLGIYL